MGFVGFRGFVGLIGFVGFRGFIGFRGNPKALRCQCVREKDPLFGGARGGWGEVGGGRGRGERAREGRGREENGVPKEPNIA